MRESSKNVHAIEFRLKLALAMAVAIFARGHSRFAAENGGEVLTGGETQVVGDVRDIFVRAG